MISLLIFFYTKIHTNDQIKINIKIEKSITKKKIHHEDDYKIKKLTKKYSLIKTSKNKVNIIKNIKPKKSININFTGMLTSNVRLTNKHILINTNDKKLISINIHNNTCEWKTIINHTPVTTVKNSKILISNNKIYQITPNKNITILKKNTGIILTIKNIELKESGLKNYKIQKFFKKIYFFKNKIYICYSDGNLISIDGTSGKKIWQKTKNNYKNFIIKKQNLIIIKTNGNITSLDATSGKKNWTNRSLNSKSINFISIINNKIIAIEKNWVIHILDENNGYIIKSLKIKNCKIENILKKKDKLIIFKKNNKIIKLSIKNND